jgi:hypothetical protein
MRELLPPEKKDESEKTFIMPWDLAAQDEFNKIPENAQPVVAEFIEEIGRNKGSQLMTHELFIDIVDQYAPPEFRERFG